MRGRILDTSSHDLTRVSATAQAIIALCDELKQIFPGREVLITQIKYALLTREHILIFGTFGTGKSDLIRTLLSAIRSNEAQQPRLFSIEVNQFTTEAHLVGVLDVAALRDEKVHRYLTGGTILEADFAELDELFNGPQVVPVLRGVLHDRLFKRGHHIEEARILTAFAATNLSPQEVLQQSRRLAPDLDRFIYHVRVDYLESDNDRIQMYQKYLVGATPTTTIDLEDLRYTSQAVVAANQIDDDHFIEVYNDVVQAYRAKVANRIVISDRRAAKLLQVVEAEAICNGRYDVLLEDIMAIEWGICEGGNTEQHELFKAAATDVINKALAQGGQSIDDVQKRLLEKIESQLPVIPPQPDPNQLVNLFRALHDLRKEADAVTPQLRANVTRKTRLIKKIDGLITNVEKEMRRP